ncbi:ABC transporter substrate-binding protein [Bartonella sp. B10834G6]|uniref:ABC transporter substrate-binding protein n=1 Tax=Bartonella apis TaxID=1686310 RepID=UPI0018DB90D7|nr:PhnD/SsuA/transferrin family substrate-binding protein [Bartonella apis]MBH9981832.1 ABC transporter substrate-binding protein [Bartonella apis]
MMLTQTRRHFLIGASLLPIVYAFPTIGAAEGKKPVIWGPPAGPSIVAAYAVKTGMLEDLLPGCQFKVWNNPDQIRAGLGSGSINMAILPSYSGANLYNKGLGVKLANILTDGLLYIVAPQASNIKTLQDLVGKKLAVPFKNDMPDYIMQAILKAYDIKPDAIDIQYTGSLPEAMPLLMIGRVDAAVIVEPAASTVISMSTASPKKIVRALDIQKLWEKVSKTDAIPQAGLVVGKGFEGEEGKKKIAALNECFSAALEKIKANPEKAAEQVGDLLDFPPRLIAASVAFSHLVVHNAIEAKPSLETFFNVLIEQNSAILGGKLPDDGFYA